MGFKCSPNCWAPCCRNLQVFPEMSEFHSGDGLCKHLKSDNSCSIYESRPDLCRMEVIWKRDHSEMEWDLYLFLTDQACEQLRRYLVDRKPKT
jgi:uncharacterized protein